jgi:hypothetical protein
MTLLENLIRKFGIKRNFIGNIANTYILAVLQCSLFLISTVFSQFEAKIVQVFYLSFLFWECKIVNADQQQHLFTDQNVKDIALDHVFSTCTPTECKTLNFVALKYPGYILNLSMIT